MIVGRTTAAVACGVVMNRPVRLLLISGALALLTVPAVAFQETTVGGGKAAAPAPMAPADNATPQAPTLEKQKPNVDPGKGVTLSMPEVSLGKNSGTEVRIPGLGTVGVLPKLDFGLELLYGANEGKGVPEDRNEPNDLQIRGTIKHRF
jgi:hypothetical protein